MGQIYKVTDLTNNFVYIGKTTQNINKRKKDHLSKSRRKANNLRFHNAIRTHGQDNFVWEILEECSDNLLDEKEIFYISKFKSNNKSYGYNMTEGGDNDPKVNIGRKKSKETCLKISKALRGRKFSEEHKKKLGKAQSIRYKSDLKMQEHFKDLIAFSRKKIVQYDLKGNKIKFHESAVDAANLVGVDPSNITRACQRNNKTTANFIWRYDGDIVTEGDLVNLNERKKISKESIQNRSKSLSKPVFQLSSDGTYMKEWGSIKDAANTLKIDSGGISRACSGFQQKAGGYKWKYAIDK